MSGKLQMEQECNAVTPKLQWEGNTVLYHESGAVHEVGPFKDEDRFGFHKFWYPDGSKEKEVFYKDKKTVYFQYWSKEGTPLLLNGTGLARGEIPHQFMGIRDSLMVASYGINDANDTTYSLTEHVAEYKSGMNGLQIDLRSNLQYPRSARKSGKEGVVYVGFIIGKTGMMKDVQVVKGLGGDLDEESVRAVKMDSCVP